MKIDQLLKEYRRGDADSRISLCLYYREFRNDFSDIEHDDPMDLETSRQESWPHQLFSAILHVLRKYASGIFFRHNNTNRLVLFLSEISFSVIARQDARVFVTPPFLRVA